MYASARPRVALAGTRASMKVIGDTNGENGYPEPAACRTESEMQTREDLVELARAFLKQARVSKNPVVVAHPFGERISVARGIDGQREASRHWRGCGEG
jgi:hypothetical protein